MDEQLIQTMIDEAIGPYEEQIEVLKQENLELRQKLSIFGEGNQISQNEFNALDEKCREQQDQIYKLKRDNSELESKCNSITQKCQSLEDRLQRINADITNGAQETKNKGAQIESLRKELERAKETIVKNRADLTNLFEEKKAANERLREMTTANQNLQELIEEFMEKDKKLIEVIQEKSSEITEKDSEISDLQRRVIKVEAKLKKIDKNAVTDPTLKMPISKQEGDLSDDIQAQLTKVKKLNREYRERILKLQDEERKAQRLSKALESRQKQIVNLQELLDKNERECLSYKQSAEDFANQIALYREEKEMYAQESGDQVAALKKEMDETSKRFQFLNKQKEDLEQIVEEKNQELNELRVQIKNYESGEFGLPQAIDEMKELRAMVEVREKHISELIAQVNSMDKIINGLTIELGSNFDYDEFLKSLDKKAEEQEQLRVERARRELEEKVRQLRERPKLGTIQIVVNDSAHQEFDLKSVVKAQTQKRKPKKKKETVKVQTRELDKTSFSSLSDADSSTTHQSSDLSQQDYRPGVFEVKDEEVQATDMPLPPQFAKFDDDRDEWVANLQKQYLALQQKFKDLQNELSEGRLKYLHMETELQNNNAEKQNMSIEIDELRRRLQNAGSNTYVPPPVPVQEQPKPQIVHVPAPEQPKPHLFMSMISNGCNIPIKEMPPLSFDCKPIALFPTERELSIIKAREEEKASKLNDAIQKSSDLQARIDDLSRKMAQKDNIIVDNQDTINKLEKQLQEQRDQFKDRLRQLQDETQRNVEARIKELQDANAITNGGIGGDGNYAAIPEVSKRLKSLNEENQGLRNRVNDLEEIIKVSKQTIEDYKVRVKGYEAEKAEVEEKPEKTKIDGPLSNPYAQKLQQKNAELKRKIAYLNDQLDQAKRSRPSYDTIASESAATDTSNQNDQVEKLTAQMKNYKVKYMQAKSQQDELIAKLEKEKETNERLKAMLQKKEAAIEKITDKFNQYKHQNEKLTEKYTQFKRQNEKLKAYVEKGGKK